MNFKKIFIAITIIVIAIFFIFRDNGTPTENTEKKAPEEVVVEKKLPTAMFISELTSMRESIDGMPTFPITIGTKVSIVEDQDPWIKVQVEDHQGWIERRFLSEVEVKDQDIFTTKKILKDVVVDVKSKDKDGNEIITQKTEKQYVDVKVSIKEKYKLGDVQFAPIIKTSYQNNPKIHAKAIYISLYGLKHLETNTNNYIELAKKSNINAFVIDVKDDLGWTLFPAKISQEMLGKYYRKPRFSEEKIKKLIKELKENDIYLIARISTFKDTAYAKNHPEDAILDKRYNKTYQSRDKVQWTSPYDRTNWYYNIELSKEAADLGFNEILFDYVRFPDQVRRLDSKSLLDYKNIYNETKPEVIQRFLKYAHDELSKKEVYVAASIFGQIGISDTDEAIGQHWETLSVVADYLNPMSYPSHFAPGTFNYKIPDANPYGLMKEYSRRVNERDSKLENPATVVMWIQSFSAPWVKGYIKYGTKEVKAQIKGLKDEGLEGYLVWNSASRYFWDAFKDDKKVEEVKKSN
jgi:hypothetical protein